MAIVENNKYVNFLQWALPVLNFRWRGFRKVRRQVYKRIDKRIIELGLTCIGQYRNYLEKNSEEWSVLDHFCRITISRFYRDSRVFDYLGSDVLPALVNSIRKKNINTIRVWSAGCASGEEPYTVAILWHYLILPKNPDFHLEIIATDIDPIMIKRGKASCYKMSSLRNLPVKWLEQAFDQKNGSYFLKRPFKEYVRFALLDIRQKAPDGVFQIILCRNLAFTYFDFKLQQLVLKKLFEKIETGGVLVTGTHEQIPIERIEFKPWAKHMPIYQKV